MLPKSQAIVLLRKLDPDKGNRRALENLLVALVQLCAQCCHSLTGWFDRRERRKNLKRDIESLASRKALKQLIMLTRAAIEACIWREEFHVTSLLVEDMMPKPKARSAEATAKMLATKAAKAKAQQDAVESRIQARREAA